MTVKVLESVGNRFMFTADLWNFFIVMQIAVVAFVCLARVCIAPTLYLEATHLFCVMYQGVHAAMERIHSVLRGHDVITRTKGDPGELLFSVCSLMTCFESFWLRLLR